MRAVFLDRDGVLNRPVVRNGRPYPPETLEQFEIYPDAYAALAALRREGFRLVVVTNQPDVARGTQTRSRVDAMHAHLQAVLPLDEIRVCFHDDGECECRKPRPGLLLADPGIDMASSFMVGDRWRDIEAGQNAGCTTVFVDHGYLEPRTADADATVSSITEAVHWILEYGNRSVRERSPRT